MRCRPMPGWVGSEFHLADGEAPTVSGLLGAVADVPREMLTAGEVGWGLYGNSGTIFATFLEVKNCSEINSLLTLPLPD